MSGRGAEVIRRGAARFSCSSQRLGGSSTWATRWIMKSRWEQTLGHFFFRPPPKGRSQPAAEHDPHGKGGGTPGLVSAGEPWRDTGDTHEGNEIKPTHLWRRQEHDCGWAPRKRDGPVKINQKQIKKKSGFSPSSPFQRFSAPDLGGSCVAVLSSVLKQTQTSILAVGLTS